MDDSKKEKELTLTALVLGVLLAIVFGAANAYLGLRVGLTVSASVPAAVISMGVLRFVLRRDSILENNMVQTIGSAGESLAAGAIFTLPALYLWAGERPAEFAVPELLSVTLIALAGGILGVLLMVPLRRPLIVADKTLTYPEGLACADVLRAGEAGAKHAKNVFAVGEITWLIDSIISILVGLLCGGSGVALISSGPAGIIAGIMISYMVLLLGKNRMEGALLKTDLPVFMRKMIPKGAFKSRIGQMSGQIRAAVYEHLEKEKNEEITERMVNEISSQIELCLTKMAEVVEIPLG